MRKKPSMMAVFAVVVVLIVGACTPAASTAPTGPAATGPAATGPAATGPAATGPAATQAPTAAAVPKVPTGYADLDAALGADKPLTGKSVNIQTQWVAGEGANFLAALADFTTATGITFKIDSIASSHESLLRQRILGGGDGMPDLAVLAQPTAVVAYGDDGKLIDIASFLTGTKLADEHPATIGPITKDGHI